MYRFVKHNSLEPFPLGNGSINLVVTSPPYYMQRNYASDPNQIGSEETIEQYVEHMLRVGKNVREVLTEDGSYFLNIGDSYCDKSLQLVPHQVALAMIRDGWILRNTIIWAKRNPTPSAVKDRLNSSHEYVFHFTKNTKYYYNLDAIREPHETLNVNLHLDKEEVIGKISKDVQLSIQTKFIQDEEKETGYKNTKLAGAEKINIGARGGFAIHGETVKNRYADGGKNPGDVVYDLHPSESIYADRENTERLYDSFTIVCDRCEGEQTYTTSELTIAPGDVWVINNEPSKVAHFAPFPKKLVKKIVLAASRVGDTVLDPFIGSGTTSLVAEELHRDSVGFDLSYNEVRESRLGAGIQTSIIF